jgi:hypothetical protein
VKEEKEKEKKKVKAKGRQKKQKFFSEERCNRKKERTCLPSRIRYEMQQSSSKKRERDDA